tara:strand:- start:423 stop:557 length:135 start_codon:yes stop_codon:yes gene_type:complete
MGNEEEGIFIIFISSQSLVSYEKDKDLFTILIKKTFSKNLLPNK